MRDDARRRGQHLGRSPLVAPAIPQRTEDDRCQSHDDQRNKPDAPRIHAVQRATVQLSVAEALMAAPPSCKFPTSAGFCNQISKKDIQKSATVGNLRSTRKDLRTPKERCVSGASKSFRA